MDIETYQNKLKDRQIEKTWTEDLTTKGGSCSICGFNDEPRIIQKHHVAGRNNSDFSIHSCPNCHAIFNMKQEPLKEERTKEDKPKIMTLGFILEGISNLLELVARILKQWAQRIFMGAI